MEEDDEEHKDGIMGALKNEKQKLQNSMLNQSQDLHKSVIKEAEYDDECESSESDDSD